MCVFSSIDKQMDTRGCFTWEKLLYSLTEQTTHTHTQTLRQSVKHSLWLECAFEGECERGSFGEEGLKGMGLTKKQINVSSLCAHRSLLWVNVNICVCVQGEFHHNLLFITKENVLCVSGWELMYVNVHAATIILYFPASLTSLLKRHYKVNKSLGKRTPDWQNLHPFLICP